MMSSSEFAASVRRDLARYRLITPEVSEFPYTAEAASAITFSMYSTVTRSACVDDETFLSLDRETDGRLAHLSNLFGRSPESTGTVERDFDSAMDELRRGAKDNAGDTVTLDRFGCPNIAAYMAGCREVVSVSVEEIDAIDLDEFVAPWHGRRAMSPDLSEDVRPSHGYTGDDGSEWAILPYGLLWPWDMYRILANLCATGFEWTIRTTTAPKRKRPRKTRNMTTRQVVMPNDAITNAFFGRDSNAIQPWDYFGHETPETALPVVTSSKGSASIVVIHGASTTVDAAIETYRLTPEDRFWLEAICSLARDGYGVIRGSDLLKFNGYKNPYQPSAKDVMRRAYQSVRKMWRIHIAIDTTQEKKGSYSRLLESYDEQPLVDCNWSVMRFDGDAPDFEIKLNLTNDGTPLGALPLAVYAADKKQLLLAERTDLEFATIGKLTLDHRLMWRYVLRRMKDRTTSTTIVFDTVFKNIGIESADRYKRAKMLNILQRMLEERQKDGALDFTWNWDKAGRAQHSVTITPVLGKG